MRDSGSLVYDWNWRGDVATTTIPANYMDLFKKPAFASLATLNPDVSPQVTPVWVDFDDAWIFAVGVRPLLRQRRRLDLGERNDCAFAFRDDLLRDHEYVAIGYGPAVPRDRVADQAREVVAGRHLRDAGDGERVQFGGHVASASRGLSPSCGSCSA